MGSLLCCHKGLLLDLQRGEAALHARWGGGGHGGCTLFCTHTHTHARARARTRLPSLLPTRFPYSVVLLWEYEWDTLKSSYIPCEEVRLWRRAEGEGGKEEEKTTPLLSNPGGLRAECLHCVQGTRCDVMHCVCTSLLPHVFKAVCWKCVETQKKQEAMVFDKAHVYIHATEGDPHTVEESRPAHSGWSLRYLVYCFHYLGYCHHYLGYRYHCLGCCCSYLGILTTTWGAVAVTWAFSPLPGVLLQLLGHSHHYLGCCCSYLGILTTTWGAVAVTWAFSPLPGVLLQLLGHSHHYLGCCCSCLGILVTTWGAVAVTCAFSPLPGVL